MTLSCACLKSNILNPGKWGWQNSLNERFLPFLEGCEQQFWDLKTQNRDGWVIGFYLMNCPLLLTRLWVNHFWTETIPQRHENLHSLGQNSGQTYTMETFPHVLTRLFIAKMSAETKLWKHHVKTWSYYNTVIKTKCNAIKFQTSSNSKTENYCTSILKRKSSWNKSLVDSNLKAYNSLGKVNMDKYRILRCIELPLLQV